MSLGINGIAARGEQARENLVAVLRECCDLADAVESLDGSLRFVMAECRVVISWDMLCEVGWEAPGLILHRSQAYRARVAAPPSRDAVSTAPRLGRVLSKSKSAACAGALPEGARRRPSGARRHRRYPTGRRSEPSTARRRRWKGAFRPRVPARNTGAQFQTTVPWQIRPQLQSVRRLALSSPRTHAPLPHRPRPVVVVAAMARIAGHATQGHH